MAVEGITPKEKLAADLKTIIADMEDFLKATAGQAGEKLNAKRARIEEALRDAKSHMMELEDAAVEKAKAVAQSADDYVHEKPWQAIGIAAGVGFVIGWLFGRR